MTIAQSGRLGMLAAALLAALSLGASDSPKPIPPISIAPENPPSLPQIAVPPVSLDQYVAELERLSAAFADAPNHPEKISELRASLPAQWAVQTPSGTVAVSTTQIADSLKRWDKEPEKRTEIAKRIGTDLAAMRQQALGLKAAPEGPSPALAEAKLKEVLSRREFHSVQGPSWWDEQWAKFKQWLADLWDRLFGNLHVNKSVGSAISWMLIGVAFVILVWLIARNLLAQSRAFGLHLQAPVRTHQSSREWANAAIAAANAGDFREAIHCAYWAAVYRLDEAGVWTLDATRTPREYLRLLKQDVPQRPAMREITRNFEVVWYGTKPASAGDFRVAVNELEKLGCHLPSVAATESSSSAPA
jgi:hypothetical protein